jgi:uncharacterized protein (DUF1015 family)
MKIYGLHPELKHATNNVDTLYQLIEATTEAYHVIDERVLQNISNTMPQRVQAIITADGWCRDVARSSLDNIRKPDLRRH